MGFGRSMFVMGGVSRVGVFLEMFRVTGSRVWFVCVEWYDSNEMNSMG